MLAGVRDHDGLSALGCEAYETIAEREGDLAHRFLVEPDRRLERQVGQLGTAQVQRTRVGIQSLGDQLDDVIQRLAEVMRSRNDLGDIG